MAPERTVSVSGLGAHGWSRTVALLVRDGEVLATAEVAVTRRDRRRGLAGRDGVDGVLVLIPCRQVHTVGMRFPLDVAFCGVDGEVLHLARLAPWRVSRVVWRARCAVEAEAGAFERWGLAPGDRVVLHHGGDGDQ